MISCSTIHTLPPERKAGPAGYKPQKRVKRSDKFMNFMVYYFLVGISLSCGIAIVLAATHLVAGLLHREKPRYKIKLMHSLGGEVGNEHGA